MKIAISWFLRHDAIEGKIAAVLGGYARVALCKPICGLLDRDDIWVTRQPPYNGHNRVPKWRRLKVSEWKRVTRCFSLWLRQDLTTVLRLAACG